MCMIGMIMVFGALSYQELDKVHSASVDSEIERILVIDAGHGGDDGGAVSEDGVLESDLNLSISRKLDLLARLCGVCTRMTRSTSEISYPDAAGSIAARKVADQKQRVALINETPNAFVISIHQNQYPTPTPHGAQVLYGTAPEGKALGGCLQELLVSSLDVQNRRVAAPIPDNIYLFKNISCPAVLVECGFLSNPEECRRLQTASYQTSLAMTILSSYLQYNQNGCRI